MDVPPYNFLISLGSAVIMTVEFALNNVPITPFLANIMVLYAVVYSLFAWAVYFFSSA